MKSLLQLRNLTWATVAICCLSLVVATGCKPASDGTLDLLDTKLSSIKIDDLARTMDFVFSDKRFDQDEFVRAVTGGLNRWTRSEPEKLENDGWKLDETLEPITSEFSDMPLVLRLSEMNYVNTDPYFLQQAAWLNKIAERIAADKKLYAFQLQRLAAGEVEPTEDGDPLATALAKIHDGLSAEDAADLAKGMRGFDWVVRNIQMDPDPASVEDELTPGLGYKRYPWQVLIYSRGDFVERAKVFMLLAQQMGLDSVMLYVGEGESARPWCPALLVGGKLFLFDTKLGLPIPAGKPASIATLAEVKANPEWLKALDLTTDESLADDTAYWVEGSELDSVQALVYTSPELASRRMFVLEQNLSGNYKLPLSSKPSDVVNKLPEGVSGKAWDIGFKTHKFRSRLREAITESRTNDVVADKIRWHFLEESYIDEFSVYRTGRARYFNGRFQVEGKRRTAIESFDALMYEDQQISDLATDTFLQRQLGIRTAKGQDLQSFQRQVRGIQEQMKLVRRDAGFFMAQCHFDNGNISTTAKWLERMLEKPDTERWQPGVEYLLGRASEASGDYDAAMAFYGRNDDSPQVHGNLIRTRMLKDLIQQILP